jgi:hypothetical protein
MLTETELLNLLPLACSWVEEQEAFILKNGTPLSDAILKDSEELGIKLLNRVRILPVETIPLPSNEILRKAILDLGFIGKNTIGISFRYGIFVQVSHYYDKRLIIHELTHTMQYERVGGIYSFLKQYVVECIKFGYPHGMLEQEAIYMTNKIYP